MSRTTDKYRKVPKQNDSPPENEVRIKAVNRVGQYITYAASLLLEKKLERVVIKASGNAAKNACLVAETLRHKILGLHQLTSLKTTSVVDEYEPKEDGLDKVVVERKLAVLEISLSLQNVFDTKAPGYQAPLPKDQVQEEELAEILRRRGPRGTPGEKREGEETKGEEREGRGQRGEGRGQRGEGRGFRRGRFAGGRGGFARGGRGGRRDFEGRRDYEGGRRDYEGGRREYEGRRDYEGGRRNEGRRDYEGGRRDYEGRREYEGERRGEGPRRGGYGGRGNTRGGRGGQRNQE